MRNIRISCSRCAKEVIASTNVPDESIEQVLEQMGGCRLIDGAWVCGDCNQTGVHYYLRKRIRKELFGK